MTDDNGILPNGFSKLEYQKRVRNVLERAHSMGVDRVLVVDPENIAYLTGYYGPSSYVPQLLVIEAGVTPILFLRTQDCAGAMHVTWLPRASIRTYPEEMVGDPDADPWGHILSQFNQGGRTGCEFPAINPYVLRHFQARFGAHLIDIGGLVHWVRIVKSGRELEVMREAAGITDLAMRRASEVIAPGVRECDAAAEITAALVRGSPDYGGLGIQTPLIASGIRTGTPHLMWLDTAFPARTQVNLELGGCRYGYYAGLMRTVAIGEPSDRLKSAYAAALDGLAAALDTVRPGVTCGEVAESNSAALAKHDIEKRSRCGYAIGLGWLEPSASLRIGDRTVLQPGMTFHLMLGNWITPDFGYTLSETFVVTETGAQTFSALPRDLMRVA